MFLRTIAWAPLDKPRAIPVLGDDWKNRVFCGAVSGFFEEVGRSHKANRTRIELGILRFPRNLWRRPGSSRVADDLHKCVRVELSDRQIAAIGAFAHLLPLGGQSRPSRARSSTHTQGAGQPVATPAVPLGA